MSRVTLTELALNIALGDEPGKYQASWSLWRQRNYPAVPGVIAEPELRRVIRTTFELDPDHEATDLAILAERVLDEAAAAIVRDCARVGGFRRVAIDVPEGLDDAPWEKLFVGLPVVRRASARPHGPRRPPLTLPLRLIPLYFGAPQRLALRDLIGDGAADLDVVQWATGEDDADIVHMRWQDLVRGEPNGSEPEEPAPGLRWRLLVIHEVDSIVAPARGARVFQAGLGVDAVLFLATADPEAVHTFYELALQDWPLDRAVEAMRERHKLPPGAAVLRCAPGGETCIGPSAVIDGAIPDTLRVPEAGLKSGHLESVEVDEMLLRGADRTRATWRSVLAAPLRDLASEAQLMASLQGTSDIDRDELIAMARSAGALAIEHQVVDSVLDELNRADADTVADVTARATQVWITRRGRGVDVAVPADRALIVSQAYRLHVQIVRTPLAAAWARPRFPEGALAETLAILGTIELTVVLYPLGDVITLAQRSGPMRLPKLGDGEPIAVDLTVTRPGPFAVRVCVFHGKALLQSVVIEGTCDEHDRVLDRGGALTATLDFASSNDFLDAEGRSQPDVTIWTNHTSDGSHWFGLFTGGDDDGGEPHSLSHDDLVGVARRLQQALADVEMVPARTRNEQPRYRFEPPAAANEDERAARIAKLVELARTGWGAYNDIFGGLDEVQSPAAMASGALLQIARCRPERTNIAWAALYDHHLDSNEPLSLCGVFDTQLREGNDLLDQPAECRAQRHCPLGEETLRRTTVCPFGFWGVRHRIEQPPSHVTVPEGEARTPGALQRIAGMETSIPRPVGGDTRVGIAWWPHFDERVKAHLESLRDEFHGDLEHERTRVLTLLERGKKQLYYFFCHGDGERGSFRLRVGPSQNEHSITVGDLNDRRRFSWTADGPLVFLNGCNTTAFNADTINHLLGRLRANGASGVIGTEIPVHTFLAEDVGERLIRALARGDQLGDAFLRVRRDLLRTQLNPLGLAYSFFGAAQLHLCDGAGCRGCGKPREDS